MSGVHARAQRTLTRFCCASRYTPIVAVAIVMLLTARGARAADAYNVRIVAPYVASFTALEASSGGSGIPVPKGVPVDVRFTITGVAPPFSVEATDPPPGLSLARISDTEYALRGIPQPVKYPFPTPIEASEGSFNVRVGVIAVVSPSLRLLLVEQYAECSNPLSWVVPFNEQDEASHTIVTRFAGVWLPPGDGTLVIRYESPTATTFPYSSSVPARLGSRSTSRSARVVTERYQFSGSRRFEIIGAAAPGNTRITLELECPIVVLEGATQRAVSPAAQGAVQRISGRRP